MSSFMKTTDNYNNNDDDDVKELEITIKRCIEKLRKRKNIIKENLIDDSSMSLHGISILQVVMLIGKE